MSGRSSAVARADEPARYAAPEAACANRVFPGFVNCLERSGRRPVDWRWWLADLARRHQVPARKELEDPWVKRVGAFQERCGAGDISPSDPEAAILDGAIHGAFQISRHRDPLVRAEV